MDKFRIVGKWRVVTPLLVAIICVAAMAASMCSKNEAAPGLPVTPTLNGPSQTARTMPLVDAKWKHNTYIEGRVVLKVTEDANFLMDKLSELSVMEAPPSGSNLQEWIEAFRNTFFANPTFWKKGPTPGHGWPQIIEQVWASVHNATFSIVTLTATIEYKTHAGDKPEDDADFVVTLTLTYETSNGDPIFEGTLKHSRLCEWI